VAAIVIPARRADSAGFLRGAPIALALAWILGGTSASASPPSIGGSYRLHPLVLTSPTELAKDLETYTSATSAAVVHVTEVTRGEAIVIGAMTETRGAFRGMRLAADDEVRNRTTTTIPMKIRLTGRKFSLTRRDLEMSLLNVSLHAHDLSMRGELSTDGQRIDGTFEAVINVDEMSQAFAVDFLTVCRNPDTAAACDSRGNVRLSGRFTAEREAMPFAAFVVAPLNRSVGNSRSGAIEIYFSEKPDPSTVQVRLTVCDRSDRSVAPSGGETLTWACNDDGLTRIDGALRYLSPVHARFAPSSRLDRRVWIRFGVRARAARNPDERDTRHVVFLTGEN
jgi:hypothetical protein